MGSGGSRIDDSERRNVSEEFFRTIHIETSLYYWLILIIAVVAVIANLCVIRTVILKKCKYLLKTCTISLAVSDILTVITFSLNYLDLLGKPLNLVWSLGEFLCWYNPVGQVLGNLASSLALLVIALDRYHNVIYALSKKWNPSLWQCVVATLLLWTLCFGIAYPMSTFYFHLPLHIVGGADVYMCTGTSTTRGYITFYYIIVNVLFFFPLIVMFFWFYYKIALLIWRHRKPVTSGGGVGVGVGGGVGGTDAKIVDVENTSSTRTTTDPSNNSSNNNVKPGAAKVAAATATAAAGGGFVVAIKSPPKRNYQMERKKLTFKIVIVLIIAFVVCRMPYWIYWLWKLVMPMRSGDRVWRITFIFTVLNVLNCALNPFLYTFLKQSIVGYRKAKDLVCTTCCCCFSNAEFENYENGKSIDEEMMGKSPRVHKAKQQQQQPQQQQQLLSAGQQYAKYTSVDRF